MSGERINIVIGKPFGYTPDHITSGITRAGVQLEKFKNLLNHSDPVLRDAAQQAIPSYKRTLEYANSRTTDQMIGELKAIYKAIEILEKNRVPEEDIEDFLWNGFREPVLYYRDILNEGWIETAFQRVVTVAMRQD